MHWRAHIQEFQSNLKTQNVIVTDALEGFESRYFGFQFWPDFKSSEAILRRTQELMNPFVDFIHWQVPESVHFTILGYKIKHDFDISENVLNESLKFFKEKFRDFASLDGKAVYPIVSQTGVAITFEENGSERFHDVRGEVSELFERLGLQPTISIKYYNLFHAFLGRFKKSLTAQEIDSILSTPEEVVDIKLNKVRIALSDRFISPSSVQEFMSADLK